MDRRGSVVVWALLKSEKQCGWERKWRSSSFFYLNTASRASEKMNCFPCSSRCWPSGHAAWETTIATWNLLSSQTRRGFINRRPCPRVRPRATRWAGGGPGQLDEQGKHRAAAAVWTMHPPNFLARISAWAGDCCPMFFVNSWTQGWSSDPWDWNEVRTFLHIIKYYYISTNSTH